MSRKTLKIAAVAAIALAATSAVAAPVDAGAVNPFLPQIGDVKLDMTLGAMDIAVPTDASGAAAGRKVVFKQEVDLTKLAPTAENVYWARLRFDLAKTKLRRGTGTGWGANQPGDLIRITGDSGVQHFNADTLKQWNGHSAFFNGNKVTVELLADPTLPAADGDKLAVVISTVVHNTPTGGISGTIRVPPPNSICSFSDLRRPSQDPRQGRMYPPGCTGWAAKTGKKGCMLAAAHCFDGSSSAEEGFLMQSNVPQSAAITVQGKAVGIPRHPSPANQWFIDPKSVQFNLGGVNDEDWSFFGTFPNPETGRNFNEAAGREYELAKVVDGKLAPGQIKVGDTATIYGYGGVTASDRKARYLTQQVHSGKVVSFSGTRMRHALDTEGGNSGSAMVIGSSNVAFGIHVLGGCTPSSSSSSNGATLINAAGLQAALANPKGVCA